MKAAQISEYGDADVVKVTTDAPKPTPTDDQVLIEVHASNINPFDGKVRLGFMKQMKPLEFPATLGGDLAGVVAAIGKNVSNFSVGDKVYGSANLFGGGSGAFAEYAVTSPKNLAKMPKSLDFTESASLPLTAVSALQVLHGHMKISAGQKILIHGGSGGIGSIAIQVAKHNGAHVTTTVSAASFDYVKQLGADEVIDYKTQKFEEMLSGLDAVFDTVGGETYDKSYQVLKKRGMLVSMVMPPNEELAKKHGVTAVIQMTKINTEDLEKLAKLVQDGSVKPEVDSVFPLDKIQEAFRAQEEGSPHGKVIVKIR
jgi:alcohol dehydrogenase